MATATIRYFKPRAREPFATARVERDFDLRHRDDGNRRLHRAAEDLVDRHMPGDGADRGYRAQVEIDTRTAKLTLHLRFNWLDGWRYKRYDYVYTSGRRGFYAGW